MANQIDRAEYWPLVSGALDSEVLRPFAPLSAKAVAQAYELGFLNQQQLFDLERKGLFPTKSAYLPTFLKTATYIDRRRDISEELKMLAETSPEGDVPLWMILARLIIQRYNDPDAALATLEQLYQWCDTPMELRPYTLYGTPNVDVEGASRSRELIDALDGVLRRSGV